MKNYLLAWLHVKQSHSLSLRCVCSEVQDLRPANEALPQRKPPQKDALRQQQAHREGTPVHEAGLAGRTVSPPAFLVLTVSRYEEGS